jgi:hypothetical protein
MIVTLERTPSTGAYAGLPAGVHVTLARVRAVRQRWVVSGWNPTCSSSAAAESVADCFCCFAQCARVP